MMCVWGFGVLGYFQSLKMFFYNISKNTSQIEKNIEMAFNSLHQSCMGHVHHDIAYDMVFLEYLSSIMSIASNIKLIKKQPV